MIRPKVRSFAWAETRARKGAGTATDVLPERIGSLLGLTNDLDQGPHKDAGAAGVDP